MFADAAGLVRRATGRLSPRRPFRFARFWACGGGISASRLRQSATSRLAIRGPAPCISTHLATYSTYYGIPPPECAVPDRQFASPCFQKADQRWAILSVAQLSGLSMHVLSGKLRPNGSVDSSHTCGRRCLMMKLPAPTVRMTVEGKDPEILLQTQAALILSVRFQVPAEVEASWPRRR